VYLYHYTQYSAHSLQCTSTVHSAEHITHCGAVHSVHITVHSVQSTVRSAEHITHCGAVHSVCSSQCTQ